MQHVVVMERILFYTQYVCFSCCNKQTDRQTDNPCRMQLSECEHWSGASVLFLVLSAPELVSGICTLRVVVWHHQQPQQEQQLSWRMLSSYKMVVLVAAAAAAAMANTFTSVYSFTSLDYYMSVCLNICLSH